MTSNTKKGMKCQKSHLPSGVRIIQRARMSTTFCSVCGFDTPHLGAGCLVCHEVAKNQEANRLDAMTLYDGAAIEVKDDS